MNLGHTAAITDPGRRRRQNEDAFVREQPLFAVADGMGGAQAGEIASRLAAAALRQRSGDDSGNGRERVVQLIQEANRRVYERSSEDEAVSGMGTTMTVALVEDTAVWIGHVGDSRAYLVRDGRLEQLTEDHSLVAELVRSGKLSPEEAEIHPQRSVITRALGTDPDVDVDAFAVDGEAGDVYLICSDGLSDMVDGIEIEAIMREQRTDLEAAARALIHAANRAGGDDNITAILFELVEDDEPDEVTREYVEQAASPDDEDTLHPEDRVAVPVEVAAAVDEAAAPQAGLGRRLLALAVIVALSVAIVVLVWWGLAR